MSQDFNDFIAEVKERADILRIIGRYVPLKKSGSRYVGRCPFHNDNKPSMSVNPYMKIYKCFACGAGGDVFKFIQEYDKLSFIDALKLAAEDAGLTLPSSFANSGHNRNREKNELILEANGLAAGFFQVQLERSAEVQQYLEIRGISKQVQKHFQLGLAPNAWDGLLSFSRSKGVADDILVEAGLIKQKSPTKKYDSFRNRLMFPIWNTSNKIVAFGGRVLDEKDQPKYLNSPESPLFQKSRILYGFNFARSAINYSGEAILVEGYMDVLGLNQVGFENVIAGLGTALTELHASQLVKFVRKVYLFYDGDAAGRRAVFKNLPTLLKQGIEVKVPQLPSDEDPDSFARKHGMGKTQALLAESQNIVEFLLNDYRVRKDKYSPEEKNQLYQSTLAILSHIPADLVRGDYVSQMSEIMEVTPKAGLQPAAPALLKSPLAGREAVQAKALPKAGTSPEWQLVQLLLSSEGACQLALEKLNLDWINDEQASDLLDRIMAFYEEEGALNPVRLLEQLPEKQRSFVEIIEILEFVDLETAKKQFIDISIRLEIRYIQKSMKVVSYNIRNRVIDRVEGMKSLMRFQAQLKKLNNSLHSNIN